ncbi:MAG: hypothetical protein R2755_06435 [Acidimicrobiales bacterium]
MHLSGSMFACERCGEAFPRRHHVGRRPLYCSRTCRQRAYEARRRGAEHHRLPTAELAFMLPAAGRRDQHPGPHCYEPGRGAKRIHALRPDGPPDRNDRRPTLCGTTALALRRRQPFGRGTAEGRTCRTCSALSRRCPLALPADPATELARVRHLLATARRRIRRGEPVARRLLVDRLYLLTDAATSPDLEAG